MNKNEIDSITYTNGTPLPPNWIDFSPSKYKPVSDLITIGWESVLPEPRANSSPETLKELEYLAKLTKRLSYFDKILIETVDNEPLDLFSRTLSRNKLKPITKKQWEKIWNLARPVVMNLKIKFNRPRPYQLADIYGLKINVIETETHNTPAYPSGHTYYTAIAAHLYSAMYPDYSGEFFHKVNLAGLARCLQGVHYPSDNDAAMALSGVVWEDIKYEMGRS